MNNVTIGMDVGDKNSAVCEMSDRDDTVGNHCLENTKESLRRFFTKRKGATVVLEASTHSPWISRLLTSMGCKVLVGNSRKLRVIWDSNDKTDQRDAEMLARIARFDPELLYPVTHRGLQAQVDLKLLQSRDVIVPCNIYKFG